MRRPPLCQSLEWAVSKEHARRLENLRWSVDAGWHTEERDTPSVDRPPAWFRRMLPFAVRDIPRPLGDGRSDEG